MKFGMEVGLSPGDIVLDGRSCPSPKRGTAAPPPLFGHVYYGQTAEWIKMPLGREVGLDPCDIVLDGGPSSPLQRGTTQPPILGPCLLWSTISATADHLFIYFLWLPCVADADITFLPCGFFFFLSSFFPRLISAVAHWMSTILPHMVWP